ncbi:unnamed protein product, partial [Ectocarpus sp. 8 AP-2014]
EARGGEDWEQWVESIANGRHGKLQAEMDVMRGTNKLLLEEISGLEQQVATFRGYADQRHVTVLALRDERHRSREVAAELAALGDTASALSHLIAEGLKGGDGKQCGGGGEEEEEEEGAHALAAAGESPPSMAWRSSGSGDLDIARSRSPSAPRDELSTAVSRDSGGGSGGDGGRPRQEQLTEQGADERLSLEAARRALAEARAELGRRGRALEREADRRREVEGEARRAEGLVRAAEERAVGAEAATARASGRVSVLDRNVEYQQTQLRALRAELCQARHKNQLVRAQKAVLKKEVRDMLSRQASSSVTAAGASSSSAGRHQRRAGGGGGAWRSRARTWASMGDLAEADVAPDVTGGGGGGGGGDGTAGGSKGAGVRWASRRRSSTSECSTADGSTVTIEDDDGGRIGGGSQRRRGSMRSCLSRDSLAAASDGGDTDLADRTCSEASDLEENQENIVFHSNSSSQFREGVCRTIRKRVGPPRVPSLPPSRHRRTLAAVKNLNSFHDATALAATQQQQQQQQQSEEAFGSGGGGGDDHGVGGFSAEASGGGGGNGASSAAPAVAGLAVAGKFLGLNKGMVDKAAQEMGKKLALWPGAAGMGGAAMTSVSSLGSLAAGAITGVTSNSNSNSNSNAAGGGAGNYHPHTPLGSPRSASASVSAALTDSPVRWDPSSQHGSTVSTDLGLGEISGAESEACVNRGRQSLDAKAAAAAAAAGGGGVGAVAASALSAAVGGGLKRVSSSRTALIQLSDLELAEPCGRRIGGGGGGGGGDETGRSRPRSSATPPSSLSLAAAAAPTPSSSGKRRLSSVLPPRPDDEYELLFTTRVIGLQFRELLDGTGVCVAGSKGYVGPAPTTGVPGERLCPDNGDVLESYNGVSARGKPADVVSRELAQCGRPLRLGFRSTRAEEELLAEEKEGEMETAWVGGSRPRAPLLGGGSGGGAWGGGAAAVSSGASSCRDEAFAGPSQHPWAVSS